VEACAAVLKAIPGYFTPLTYDEVRHELPSHPAWVAEEASRLIGFIIVPRRFERAEITFAAVLPERQGQGIGTALVEQAIEALARQGVVMVEVKTLDASAGYQPYVATRAFWERRGFVQIDSIDRFRAGKRATPPRSMRGRSPGAIDLPLLHQKRSGFGAGQSSLTHTTCVSVGSSG
jgi:ribosomal protein S18 acetylase RimI-like enzyme